MHILCYTVRYYCETVVSYPQQKVQLKSMQKYLYFKSLSQPSTKMPNISFTSHITTPDRTKGVKQGLCIYRSAVTMQSLLTNPDVVISSDRTYCCVSVLRVPSIDDDVSGLQKRNLNKTKPQQSNEPKTQKQVGERCKIRCSLVIADKSECRIIGQ